MDISPSPVIVIQRKRSAFSCFVAFLLLLVANYFILKVVCAAYLFRSASPDNSVNIQVRYERDLLSEAGGSLSAGDDQARSVEAVPAPASAPADVVEPQTEGPTTATQAALVESAEPQTARWSRGPLAVIRRHPVKFAVLLAFLVTVATLTSVLVCMSQGLIPMPDFVADIFQFMGQLYEEVCQGAVYVYNCVITADIVGLARSFWNLVVDAFYQIQMWLSQAFDAIYSFFTGRPRDLEQFPTIVNDFDVMGKADVEAYDGAFEMSPPLSQEPLDISDPSKFIPRSMTLDA